MGSHTLQKKLGTRRYRTLSSKLDSALASSKFEEAAKYSTSISAIASSNDAVGILLAAAQAYKQGKSKDWRPSGSEIADAGIKQAKQRFKVTLTPSREGIIKGALSEALDRAKPKRRG